jgi:hypothetical protein
VSSVGPMPRQPVTVFFPGGTADEILTTLMKSAGLNYVMTGGPSGRLFMTMLASESGVSVRAPEPLPAPVAAAPPGVTEPEVVMTADEPTPPAEPKPDPDSSRVQGPTEWPADIAPVMAGTVHLPQSREDLFREVNGSVATTVSSEVTPNVGPQRRPGDYEPVNPPRPPAALGTATGASWPGSIAAAASASPTTPSAPGATAPALDMLQAPRTIQIPGPVVVQFPAPPKS